MQQMDGVADALAYIQPLGAAFHVSAAAFQQQYPGTVADQLAGDTDPCRPCTDDADIGTDLLVAGELPGIRQHQPSHSYSTILARKLTMRPCCRFQRRGTMSSSATPDRAVWAYARSGAG
jgi:hypothetical protein